MVMRKVIGYGLSVVAVIAVVLITVAVLAPRIGDQAGASLARGKLLFEKRCKACHDPAVQDAPGRAELSAYSGAAIQTALRSGSMKPMAQGLSLADIRSIAVYLTGADKPPAPSQAAGAPPAHGRRGGSTGPGAH